MTLDEPISENLIWQLVLTIFKSSKLKPEVQLDKGSQVGQGYLGITSRVQVKIGDEVHHIFIKMMPRSLKLRKTLLIKEIFGREVEFYLKLRPILNEIYVKYLKKSFDITPECLLIKEDYLKEAIVFENVGVRGYSTQNGRELLSKPHIMLALEKYSFLHASGFILKRDYPVMFKEIMNSNQELFFRMLEVYDMEKLVRFGLDTLQRHCSMEKDNYILTRFEEIVSKTIGVLTEKVTENIQEFSTIIHYDCWKNNLMFKNKESSNQVEDLKLVDMQMWLISSPVFDVLHVVYGNVSRHESLEVLDFYFDYYYKSLCDAVKKMGDTPQNVYPKEVYLSQLRKYSFYGFFIITLIQRVLLANTNDLPNVAEIINQDKPLSGAFILDLPDEEEYSERLKVVLRHFIKNGLL